MRAKLAEFTKTEVFRIIDQHTHQYIETLPRDEAIAKYGQFEVWGSYTDGFTSNSKPGDPKYKTTVWVWREEDQ